MERDIEAFKLKIALQPIHRPSPKNKLFDILSFINRDLLIISCQFILVISNHSVTQLPQNFKPCLSNCHTPSPNILLHKHLSQTLLYRVFFRKKKRNSQKIMEHGKTKFDSLLVTANSTRSKPRRYTRAFCSGSGKNLSRSLSAPITSITISTMAI